MLQAVHSEQVAVPTGAGGGDGAPGVFGPFLRLALDESALLGSTAAQPTAAAMATAALSGGPERFSAAGHWARESLARAQGQKLGVNLAEIAAGELASPGDGSAAVSREHATREPAGRASNDASGARDHDRRAPGGEIGRRAAESAPSGGDAEEGEPAPGAQNADRSAGRAQAGGFAAGAAIGGSAPAGAAGGVAAASGAAPNVGQAQGTSGPLSPVSASAWKLEAAGRPGLAPRQAGAGGPAAGQSAERALQSQMERGLGAVLRQGGGSLTLKLAPASLGEVRIQMTLEGGAVRARFESASGEARELMAAGLGALRAALEARGLRVESLEVASEPHERAERPAVAEPPRSEPQPEARQGEQSGRGGDRGDAGGRSAADGEGGEGQEGRSGSPEGDAQRGEGDRALEDPAIMHTAGGQSETLVSLRLDTVA